MTDLFQFAANESGMNQPASLEDLQKEQLNNLGMLDGSGKMKNIEDLKKSRLWELKTMFDANYVPENQKEK